MVTFIFSKNAERVFITLSKAIRERIISKLQELKHHDDIFSVLKRLSHFEPATHRLRIGQYRLILELKKQEIDHVIFWILDAGHRKDIYR